MLSFDEPHLVETADGTIIAMFRDCNPPDHLWQSESKDGGKTWSKPLADEQSKGIRLIFCV